MHSEKKSIIFDFISDRRTILLFGILIRLLISLNFTGWLHDDEVFQSMEITYSIIYGDEIEFVLVPYEFRYEVRSYSWPILLLPWVLSLITLGLTGEEIYFITRLIISFIGLLPILLFDAKRFEFGVLTDKRSTLQMWYIVLIQWIFAFYLPWLFLTFHINADGIGSSLVTLIIISELKIMRNQTNKTIIHKIGERQIFVFLVYGLIFSIRPQYLILLIPSLFRNLIVTFKGKEITRFLKFILYFSLGSLPRLAGDYLFYNHPFQPLINFVQFNLILQQNIIYSSLEWWFYPLEFILLYYVVGLTLIFRLSYLSFKKLDQTFPYYEKFQILFIFVYLLVFQIIQHKEPRFIILPSILLFVQSLLYIDKLETYNIKEAHHFPIKLRFNLSKNLIKIVILLLLITPNFFFPSHIQDSMWEAQRYANDLDPTGKKLIYATQFSGGGNLMFHQPHQPVKLIYVALNSTGNESLADYTEIGLMIFENSSITSLERVNNLLNYCSNPYLLKTFTDTKDIYRFVLETAAPEKIRDYSVWNCNFYSIN